MKIKYNPNGKKKRDKTAKNMPVKIGFSPNPKKNTTTWVKKPTKIGFSLNLQKKSSNEYSLNAYECSYCNQIITIDNQSNKQITITCPKCKHTGVISNKTYNRNIKSTSKQRAISEKIHWWFKPYIRAKIIGLFFLLLGVLPLLNPTLPNIKISITLVFISILLASFITEKSVHTFQPITKRNKFVISEKITFLMILTTFFLFIITNPTDLELFFVLLAVSILIIKIFVNEYVPIDVKNRLNIVLTCLFIILIIIVSERVLTFMQIL